jgi:hypothetical protein
MWAVHRKSRCGDGVFGISSGITGVVASYVPVMTILALKRVADWNAKLGVMAVLNWMFAMCM